MEIQSIRETVQQQPFRPFRSKLADGKEISVVHPDFIAIVSKGKRVAVFGADDSMSIVEPLLIGSIELPAPPTTESAGHGDGTPT